MKACVKWILGIYLGVAILVSCSQAATGMKICWDNYLGEYCEHRVTTMALVKGILWPFLVMEGD